MVKLKKIQLNKGLTFLNSRTGVDIHQKVFTFSTVLDKHFVFIIVSHEDLLSLCGVY